MDLVALLEHAANDLPPGDYSTGLNAIVRHVKAAVRHLHRDQEHDPDTCTDAIYRMNQAYEGSLKEAYRVLAGMDPSGLSPFQIEAYLETNEVVRPRVLTQLTRYRQDYRNPSTHDYKLDFDEDEALLAIVSVCAFAKLLVNQIKSKIASDAAQARAVPHIVKSSRAPLKDLSKDIACVCLAYTNESGQVGWFEFERGIAQSLRTAGFDADVSPGFDDPESGAMWDIEVKKGKAVFPIDVRVSRHGRSDMDAVKSDAYPRLLNDDDNLSGALIIIRSLDRDDFCLYRSISSAKPIFVICENDSVQIEALDRDLGGVELIN